MDEFKKQVATRELAGYATPPPPGKYKRSLSKAARRRLARATIALAKEAQKDWPPAPDLPKKP